MGRVISKINVSQLMNADCNFWILKKIYHIRRDYSYNLSIQYMWGCGRTQEPTFHSHTNKKRSLGRRTKQAIDLNMFSVQTIIIKTKTILYRRLVLDFRSRYNEQLKYDIFGMYFNDQKMSTEITKELKIFSSR